MFDAFTMSWWAGPSPAYVFAFHTVVLTFSKLPLDVSLATTRLAAQAILEAAASNRPSTWKKTLTDRQARKGVEAWTVEYYLSRVRRWLADNEAAESAV